MKKQLSVCTLMLCLFAMDGHTHARWTLDGPTPPRNDRNDIKAGPCGAPRTNAPAQFQPGETIDVTFFQHIFHRGYYRIAFSPANDENFDDYVLADNIPDFENQQYYSQQITLPDIECDQCTLQLIQVMLDRTPPSNYFSCADIQLVSTQQPPIDGEPPVTATPTPSPTITPPPVDSENDFIAPVNVSNPYFGSSDRAITLYWENPEADFAGVIVVQSPTDQFGQPQDGLNYAINDAIGNGSVIYSGYNNILLLENLAAASTYYFKIFTFDANLNYADGIIITATTQATPEQNNGDGNTGSGSGDQPPDTGQNTGGDDTNSDIPSDSDNNTGQENASSSGRWTGMDFVLLLLLILYRVRRRVRVNPA